MLTRVASDTLLRLARGFPILALTGPRQSGKTTLARAIFSNKPYISLENPDEREFADQDPRRFLSRFPDGAVLDEVQRCPALFSWLQGFEAQWNGYGKLSITVLMASSTLCGVG